MTPYEIFAEKMLHKDSKYIPEILKLMINDAQADLLVGLPGTSQEMSEKSGRDAGDVENDLQDMFVKGLSFKREKDGVITWRAPFHLAQFHDATIVWSDATEEFYEAWRKYMEIEWPTLAPVLTQFMERPYTRVIPVEKKIEIGKTQILAPENIREIINNASIVAVTKCTCRLTMKKCDHPIEVCLQVNRGAEYTIERGTGREVSKEEALKIADEARESGLVHVTVNKSNIGTFICNCCGCCCQSFTLLISDGVNLCDPSRYIPEIDNDKCSLCGQCTERCWFNALEITNDDLLVVDEKKCLGCGQCGVDCPEDAINLVEKRELEFIPS